MCAASFQAQALERLWPRLTGEEQEVALRGRNAHVGHVPKNANVADYHGATALEALFGYLYLGGEVSPPEGAVRPGDGRTLRKAVAHEGEESPYLAAGRAVYAGGFGGVRCRGERLYSAQQHCRGRHHRRGDHAQLPVGYPHRPGELPHQRAHCAVGRGGHRLQAGGQNRGGHCAHLGDD